MMGTVRVRGILLDETALYGAFAADIVRPRDPRVSQVIADLLAETGSVSEDVIRRYDGTRAKIEDAFQSVFSEGGDLPITVGEGVFFVDADVVSARLDGRPIAGFASRAAAPEGSIDPLYSVFFDVPVAEVNAYVAPAPAPALAPAPAPSRYFGDLSDTAIIVDRLRKISYRIPIVEAPCGLRVTLVSEQEAWDLKLLYW